jgi:hypothetical protein
LFVKITGQSGGVEANQVFLERLRTGNDSPIGCDGETGAIEHQAVIAADLVHHGDGNLVVLRNRRKHLLTEFAFADMERGRGDVQQDLATGAEQVFDRIDAVKAAVPEILVIPGIFTDRKGQFRVVKWEEFLVFRRGKVSALIENVVRWKQSLRLREKNFSVLKKRGRIHDTLARRSFGGTRVADNDGDAMRFFGDLLYCSLIALQEGGVFDKVSRRVAADAEFRKEDKFGASLPRTAGEFHNLGNVARKVADRSIDLPQSNLHLSSVKAYSRMRQLGIRLRAGKSDSRSVRY